MVEMATPWAFEISVFSWVRETRSASALTRLSRSVTSVRTKTMPVSGPEGLITTRTRAPLWTPMPANIAGAARVCCRLRSPKDPLIHYIPLAAGWF